MLNYKTIYFIWTFRNLRYRDRTFKTIYKFEKLQLFKILVDLTNYWQ